MKNYLNRSDFFLKGLIRIVLFYLFFLILMSSFRIFFVYYFGDTGHLDKFSGDLVYAFYLGWKYDTLVISYLLLPLYLLLFPVALSRSRGFFKVFNFFLQLFLIFFGLLIPVILISDLGFYSFFQDHINILFFGLFEDDTSALMETIWKNYPVIPILGGVAFYGFALYKITKKLFPKLNTRKSFFHAGFFKFLAMAIVSFVLLAGGLRGGYGDLVIAPKYSDFSESEFINQVSLNGVIALEKTIKIRLENNDADFNMLEAMGYKNNIHQAFSDFLGVDVSPTPKEQLINLIKRKTPFNKTLEGKKYHVVVLVMESFGGSWLKFNSETFNFIGELDRHFKEDFYFKNIISSDNGTIGSLMTVATGIPSRPGKRFLSESKFLQMPLTSSLHAPYQQHGYESTFIYGGKLGWRDIGKYFKYQGYDNLVGENAIANQLSLSGRNGTEWGLYDEHFFESIYKKLKEAKRPQFFLGLSTSNHPPFEFPTTHKTLPLEIPQELEGRILREKGLFIERFKAFQYSNVQLAKFISRIKNSSLGAETIIVVTGDHNFWGFMNYTKEEMYSKYSVPLYFYLPAEFNIEKFDGEKIGSHEDIANTLFNLTLSNTEYIAFGEDLFAQEESFALNSAVYANEEGLIYRGKEYSWSQRPLVNTKKKKLPTNKLIKRAKSSMVVSDHYLEELYQAK